MLPTSLCAGQIAQRIANHLNARKVGRDKIARFVALPHTEGCGVSSGNSEELYARTLIGHLLHPLVGPALLLEHGCEKTHNDYIRHELEREGVDLSRFGWASIQLDGGIEAVVEKTSDWFAATIAASAPTREETVGLGALRVGLASLGAVSPDLAASMSRLARLIVGAGGTVVIPENASLISSADFLGATVDQPNVAPSIDYGERPAASGLNVMATPTDHWVETLTGLGATGVKLVLVHVGERPVQAHRMIPVLQAASRSRHHRAIRRRPRCGAQRRPRRLDRRHAPRHPGRGGPRVRPQVERARQHRLPVHARPARRVDVERRGGAAGYAAAPPRHRFKESPVLRGTRLLAIVAFVLVLALPFALTACTKSGELSIKGTVTAVDATARTFSVQATDGKTYNFKVPTGSSVDLTHIKEHMDEKKQIEVKYSGTHRPTRRATPTEMKYVSCENDRST
ncbi:MAG: UxaA family hydrolase [Chloroflexia bacterium]